MSTDKTFRPGTAYRVGHRISTRWMDNDAYNHVNNVIYYSWFDSAVNNFLVTAGLLDIDRGPIIGFVVESGCRYARPISFPQPVTAMMRVGHLGTSSVRYEIGLFTDDAVEPAAEGHFIHVYVDRKSRRPVALPQNWREALGAIRAETET